MPSRVPVEPSAAAATPDPHDRELRGLALALSDGTGFRLAIATFGDTGVRDALIDRLAAKLTAAGATLSRLDVASLVSPDEREARQEFSLLVALRRHYEGQAAGHPGAGLAISVVGLEHFISEFGEGGLNALATVNLQRELFPRACPVPVVLWLPPWATTLLAQKAPDLWHWRTATFDFPGGGPAPSALSAWPELTREEWWRPVDGERLKELSEELDTLRQREGADTSPRARAYAAHLRVRLADALFTRGQLDEALTLLEEAGAIFATLGEARERAVTMGQIADILQARGELDEALRICKEEELPVYERLGDVRERAVTMGQIADILQARGELDEALRILQEDVLQAFERLGDVRSRAVTLGKIADILFPRGQLDEALRIRTEEQLPVFERLGDVRERAVTVGKVADILFRRGQLDEALRIRKEEELPVYERLGDVHSRAVTMGSIADILEARGQLDEALRIRKEEELPVYERLGDVRGLLVSRARLAQTLLIRNTKDDRPEARRLLCLALNDARRLRLPEAATIEQMLADAGLNCD